MGEGTTTKYNKQYNCGIRFSSSKNIKAKIENDRTQLALTYGWWSYIRYPYCRGKNIVHKHIFHLLTTT